MDRTESKLKSFFVFTPKDVREGEEHKKILYFYPSEVPVEEQTKHIGLAEAFVNFTSKFSSETPCETVHYEKHTATFFEGEKEYWMVMTVTNPSVAKQKEGKASVEFKENDIDDIALQWVVKQAYRMFKLFNGSIENIVKTSGEETLKNKLSAFFLTYLASLKFEQSDLFNTLEGVHFLPVDKNIYLRIQCFINLTENTFNKIQYSAFLYRDHLVWSALDQEDMRSLYKYLVQFLLPFLSDSSSLPSLIPVSKSQKGFITGIESPAPKIFVNQPEQQHQLVIYKLQEIICIFIVDNSTLEDSFYKNLGAFVSHQLDFLVPILEDHYAKKHSFEDQYKYVYFNHMNFALKTSMREKGTGVRRDTMKMLNDIHTDFETAPNNLTEVLIRTQEDKWIVGRKSDQREFYVIFDNKNSLLIEINEEVKKLSSAYFNNIFID